MATATDVHETATEPAPGPEQRRHLPIIVLLAAVCVIVLRLPALANWPSKDQAGFLAVGQQWRPGGTSLYGNYWVDRPPLSITIFKAAAALGGTVPLRLIGIAAAVIAVLAVAQAAGPLGGRRAASWAAVTAAALLVTPLTGSGEVNGELLAAPIVAVGSAALLDARVSGLSSPYPYPWFLPERTLDPQLRLLVSTLEGSHAPTWFVTRTSTGLSGVDTQPLRTGLRLRYCVMADLSGAHIYLRAGVQRPTPVLELPRSCAWQLDSATLGTFRELVDDPRQAVSFDEALSSLQAEGFTLDGNPLKTTPRGWPRDHPRIDLLRLRNLALLRTYPRRPWLHTPECLDVVTRTWRRLEDWNAWLVEHLGPLPDPTS